MMARKTVKPLSDEQLKALMFPGWEPEHVLRWAKNAHLEIRRLTAENQALKQELAIIRARTKGTPNEP